MYQQYTFNSKLTCQSSCKLTKSEKMDSSNQQLQQTFIEQRSHQIQQRHFCVYTPNVAANIKQFTEIDTSNIQGKCKLIRSEK